ncbi:MAG: transcriptional repressor [Clostridia bacterium]|nr:transcriptional repressor [Clostridia bacterium]
MEKKHYNTAGRTRLAAYLKDIRKQPPQGAEEIYMGLCRSCADEGGGAPGRSSVYRMLASLCEEGEVKKFPVGKDEAGFVYQYVGNEHHCDAHFHLHCLICGNVTHLECDCSKEIFDHLFAAHGFRADRGRSVLYGTCAACAARSAGEVR